MHILVDIIMPHELTDVLLTRTSIDCGSHTEKKSFIFYRDRLLRFNSYRVLRSPSPSSPFFLILSARVRRSRIVSFTDSLSAGGGYSDDGFSSINMRIFKLRLFL